MASGASASPLGTVLTAFLGELRSLLDADRHPFDDIVGAAPATHGRCPYAAEPQSHAAPVEETASLLLRVRALVLSERTLRGALVDALALLGATVTGSERLVALVLRGEQGVLETVPPKAAPIRKDDMTFNNKEANAALTTSNAVETAADVEPPPLEHSLIAKTMSKSILKFWDTLGVRPPFRIEALDVVTGDGRRKPPPTRNGIASQAASSMPTFIGTREADATGAPTATGTQTVVRGEDAPMAALWEEAHRLHHCLTAHEEERRPPASSSADDMLAPPATLADCAAAVQLTEVFFHASIDAWYAERQQVLERYEELRAAAETIVDPDAAEETRRQPPPSHRGGR